MGDGASDGAVELFVITGYSGAGKSEAIAAFEDSGYFCVDNLPPRMIGALGELFHIDGSNVRRAAVVSDVRGGEYFDDLLAVLDELDHSGLEPTVVFLEAEEQALLDRFKETRRRHPLTPDGRVVDGIRAEREVLGPLRERAHVVIDTTDLTGAMLRRRISAEVLGRDSNGRLALTLLTFGFKHGPPRDADMVLDVRFLPNPHYLEHLRPLTGRDPSVVQHVESGTAAREFYDLRRGGQDPPHDRARVHRRPAPLGVRRRPDRPSPRRPRRPAATGRAPRRRARLKLRRGGRSYVTRATAHHHSSLNLRPFPGARCSALPCASTPSARAL